jgi:sugar phosphate isomerase/epimerase
MINTIADGIRIKRAVDRKNLGCLVDFFHAYSNGEDLSSLDELRPGELIHAHIARPNPDRGNPGEEDLPVLIAWRDKLREIGYDGRLSVECVWKPDFDSAAAETAKVMKIFQ